MSDEPAAGTFDAELRALEAIATALDPLDRETRTRVLKWAQGRYVDGSRDIMFDVYQQWTRAIADGARDLNLAPGELEQAVLALRAAVDGGRASKGTK